MNPPAAGRGGRAHSRGSSARLEAQFHRQISDIDPEAWDGLFGRDQPFLRHAFLAALEDSACVSLERGWTPRHLTLHQGGVLAGAMPLYLKAHSHGEFVFDWAWAEAYARHGLAYYPKLLSAVPFTPVSGPRIGLAGDLDPADVLPELFSVIRRQAGEWGASGWHLLFPDDPVRRVLESGGMHLRRDVRFEWRHRGYTDFNDYLASLRASRRKNLKKERRRVREAGVRLRRVAGRDITDAEWDGFYRCYRHTYLQRSGHDGYLDRDFFRRLRRAMPESLVLVVAERDDRFLASALFLRDSSRLYGRYWGALERVDCLHFECCFYQGIEYCIEQGLQSFDPGTQGEHKLLRGFEPTTTVSLHWLADPRFHAAVGDYLDQERRSVREYARQAEAVLPFHRRAKHS